MLIHIICALIHALVHHRASSGAETGTIYEVPASNSPPAGLIIKLPVHSVGSVLLPQGVAKHAASCPLPELAAGSDFFSTQEPLQILCLSSNCADPTGKVCFCLQFKLVAGRGLHSERGSSCMKRHECLHLQVCAHVAPMGWPASHSRLGFTASKQP